MTEEEHISTSVHLYLQWRVINWKNKQNITNKQNPTKQTVGQTWRYYIVNDSCLQAENVHSNVQCFTCMTYAKETGKKPALQDLEGLILI